MNNKCLAYLSVEACFVIVSLKLLFRIFLKISDNSGFSTAFDLCNNSETFGAKVCRYRRNIYRVRKLGWKRNKESYGFP